MSKQVDVQPILDTLVTAFEANIAAKQRGDRYVGNTWWFTSGEKALVHYRAGKVRIETLKDGTITFVDRKLRIRRKPDGSWHVREGRGAYREVLR